MEQSTSPSRSTEVPTPVLTELQQALVERWDELVMLPAIAIEALEIAKDPDCPTTSFSHVVERDHRLATEILALANSAMFANGVPTASLHQAVLRLGFRRCRSLILANSAISLMKKMPSHDEWIREFLLQHSMTAATACVFLNRQFDLQFQGEEFTAGLLHDLGRSLLTVVVPEQFTTVDPLDLANDSDALDRERILLDTDHCEFGAWYAAESHLPEPLVAVIAWHHQPQLKNPHQDLIALTAAGDHIANHLQSGLPFSDYRADRNLGLEQLAVHYDLDHTELLDQVTPSMLDEIQKSVAAEGFIASPRNNPRGQP